MITFNNFDMNNRNTSNYNIKPKNSSKKNIAFGTIIKDSALTAIIDAYENGHETVPCFKGFLGKIFKKYIPNIELEGKIADIISRFEQDGYNNLIITRKRRLFDGKRKPCLVIYNSKEPRYKHPFIVLNDSFSKNFSELNPESVVQRFIV